jgi:pyridoxamine 5'-phosphate oxidase
MTKDEIVAFMNSNPACHLATADKDGQPHTRGMLMYRADDKGIIFHTGDFKDVWKQVVNNSKVEICFFNSKTNTQVRVMGTAQSVEDQALKEEIVAARPFLKPWVDKVGYEPLKVMKITGCRANVWTFDKNFEPKQYMEL